MYYTCEAGGRVGAHKKSYSRGEIGVDGLEILDILERI